MTDADAWTFETGENSVLGIGRYYEGKTLLGLFNFSEYDALPFYPHPPQTIRQVQTGKSLSGLLPLIIN